jgi:hypothetical protein
MKYLISPIIQVCDAISEQDLEQEDKYWFIYSKT